VVAIIIVFENRVALNANGNLFALIASEWQCCVRPDYVQMVGCVMHGTVVRTLASVNAFPLSCTWPAVQTDDHGKEGIRCRQPV